MQLTDEKEVHTKCERLNGATALRTKIPQQIYVISTGVGYTRIVFPLEREVVSRVIATFRASVFAGRLWDCVKV